MEFPICDRPRLSKNKKRRVVKAAGEFLRVMLKWFSWTEIAVSFSNVYAFILEISFRHDFLRNTSACFFLLHLRHISFLRCHFKQFILSWFKVYIRQIVVYFFEVACIRPTERLCMALERQGEKEGTSIVISTNIYIFDDYYEHSVFRKMFPFGIMNRLSHQLNYLR